MSIKNIVDNWSKYRKGIEDGGHHDYEHRWTMSINLDQCVGCNACSTACYAENNLATVGKEKFEAGQAMHWMRIERYWDKPESEYPDEGASFLPMMCQQCGAATCEPVCPVAATYHTPDGLNAQVYNRCVGSRYCGTNCPFKVRYFNFYSYPETAWPEPLNHQLNPDITVRDKGVMEKCTFCVQRIKAVKNTAKMEDREVMDGEVVPACVQACPSSAIVFGDTLDESSEVAGLWKEHEVERGVTKQDKQDPSKHGYRIFEELNVDPSVMYLERMRDKDI